MDALDFVCCIPGFCVHEEVKVVLVSLDDLFTKSRLDVCGFVHELFKSLNFR